MDKVEILKRVGDISQICNALQRRAISGKDDGNIYIDVFTGSGLVFSVVQNRALDISSASYKGKAISFISKNTVVSPYLFEEKNERFYRNFFGGLLTTCGMTYHGSSSYDDFHYYGTHGRYSNTPAEEVTINKEWINDEYVISIKGNIRDTKLFCENLLLKRTITTKLYSSSIEINDEAINMGFTPCQLIMLYHINVGYPLLDKAAIFNKSLSDVIPRDEEAKKGINDYFRFSDPITGYKEQVFYHENFMEDLIFGEVYNPLINTGLRIEFSRVQLPKLIQWKMLASGDYALGIEPSTNYPEGYISEKKCKQNHIS